MFVVRTVLVRFGRGGRLGCHGLRIRARGRRTTPVPTSGDWCPCGLRWSFTHWWCVEVAAGAYRSGLAEGLHEDYGVEEAGARRPGLTVLVVLTEGVGDLVLCGAG